MEIRLDNAVNTRVLYTPLQLFVHMAEKDSNPKKSSSTATPNWVVPAVAIAAVLVFAWMIQPRSDALNTNQPVIPTAPIVQTPVAPVVATLPDKVSTVTISPLAPKAGDDITFIVDLKPEFLLNWESLFSFELWVRQFGNWEKTSCYASPCTYVMSDASLGTVEYKVVRTAKNGSITDEGSTYVEVVSTTQTGDTLGPKVTVYHSPENPKSGQSVSIITLVTDSSSLGKVEIYNDGLLIKTCSQSVKISNCQVAVPNLSVGTFEYYVIASDSLGNITQSPTKTYTVGVN